MSRSSAVTFASDAAKRRSQKALRIKDSIEGAFDSPSNLLAVYDTCFTPVGKVSLSIGEREATSCSTRTVGRSELAGRHGVRGKLAWRPVAVSNPCAGVGLIPPPKVWREWPEHLLSR
jgi:hypothetical protein